MVSYLHIVNIIKWPFDSCGYTATQTPAQPTRMNMYKHSLAYSETLTGVPLTDEH